MKIRTSIYWPPLNKSQEEYPDEQTFPEDGLCLYLLHPGEDRRLLEQKGL